MTRGIELQSVRREGKRIRTEHLEVRALASLLSHPRVGLVVPRHKRTAVDRNRLKRRLRELIRTRLLPELRSGDVVVRALPEAYDASFGELATQLDQAAGRLRRLLARTSG